MEGPAKKGGDSSVVLVDWNVMRRLMLAYCDLRTVRLLCRRTRDWVTPDLLARMRQKHVRTYFDSANPPIPRGVVFYVYIMDGRSNTICEGPSAGKTVDAKMCSAYWYRRNNVDRVEIRRFPMDQRGDRNMMPISTAFVPITALRYNQNQYEQWVLEIIVADS